MKHRIISKKRNRVRNGEETNFSLMSNTTTHNMTEASDDARVERLTEHIGDWGGRDLQVDASRRTVRNVALAGLKSKNGYRYGEQTLREAVLLYENKPVFLDHAANASRPYERSTRDLVGSIAGPRFHEGRIRADIQLLDTEAGRTFLALAETKSTTVGMSHVVLAERSVDRAIVERIHEVISVDAVVFPATASTFQESAGSESAGETELCDANAARRTELEEQLEAVTLERDALRERIDELEREQQSAGRRVEIEGLLTESRLPAYAVTDLFRAQLLAAEPESRRTLIRERQALLEQLARHGPMSRERAGVERGVSDAAVIAAIRGRRP
jgi:hypothetical protein